MIDQSRFELIKEKHGHYASWAVWTQAIKKAKENVGDLSIFEIRNYGSLLKELNPNVVLIGLNISRPIQFPLGNFHDARPNSMDYKIRYALKGTALWGAYLTDIIKDFEQKAAGKMMSYLRSNRRFEKDNLELFKRELRDLGVDRPLLIAFGGDAFQVLRRNLETGHDIWKVPHYSNYISKENYREQVAAIIETKTSIAPKSTE